MKKMLTIACLLAMACLEANESQANLTECDKTTCLEQLETATDTELWDTFLQGQTKLFFDPEFIWIAKGSWWQEAKHVLEIGSGNGAYLYELSRQFPEKTFLGIEKFEKPLKQANERYAGAYLEFQEGDAEVLDQQLVNSADVVLFRLTLQHLKDPVSALKNAASYLLPGGYVVIIDSYDKAKRTSHPIPTINEALEVVAEAQKKTGVGNRLVTFELLQALEAKKSPLSELYEVVSTNLDVDGNIVGDTVLFEGEKSRLRYFTHNLMFLTLLHRIHHFPVDLNRAYDELQDYLHDENAWSSPGVHLLVLKKRQ